MGSPDSSEAAVWAFSISWQGRYSVSPPVRINVACCCQPSVGKAFPLHLKAVDGHRIARHCRAACQVQGKSRFTYGRPGGNHYQITILQTACFLVEFGQTGGDAGDAGSRFWQYAIQLLSACRSLGCPCSVYGRGVRIRLRDGRAGCARR